MLAEAATVQRGFTAAVVEHVLAHAFADPAVRRLVAEPDARNTKAVALVRRLGSSSAGRAAGGEAGPAGLPHARAVRRRDPEPLRTFSNHAWAYGLSL